MSDVELLIVIERLVEAVTLLLGEDSRMDKMREALFEAARHADLVGG